jgi:hypothetical protein
VLIDARNPPTEPVPAQQNYPAILGVLESAALAGRLAERVHYVEVMVKRSFTDVFAQSLGFSHGNHSETPMSRTN